MVVIAQEQITFEQAKRHWYYRAKYAAMVDWVSATGLNKQKARVGDFGCGAGLFLSLLIQGGVFPRGNLLGIDSAYPNGAVLPQCGVRVVPSLECEAQFDLFLLMDVLEHIEDDRGALESVLSHCRAGGYLFITVPAMEWLWSGHDSYLGHKRRYTVNSLGKLLKSQHNLEIIGLHYFYASILPIAIPLRLLRRSTKERTGSDMRAVPNMINSLIQNFLRFEVRIMKHNRFAGLTVMALCRKKSRA